MENYSKKRIVTVLAVLFLCVLFEIKAVGFFQTYFDANYKVIIAGIVAFLAFWYVLFFGVAGMAAFVYGIAKEKETTYVTLGLMMISIAVIICCKAYLYFKESFVVDVICVVAFAVLLAIGVLEYFRVRKTK